MTYLPPTELGPHLGNAAADNDGVGAVCDF